MQRMQRLQKPPTLRRQHRFSILVTVAARTAPPHFDIQVIPVAF